MIIDAADCVVAEARMFQCEPFEIQFKQASRGVHRKIPQEFMPEQSVFHTRDTLDMTQRIKATCDYLNGLTTPAVTNESNHTYTLAAALKKAEAMVNKDDGTIEFSPLTASGK